MYRYIKKVSAFIRHIWEIVRGPMAYLSFEESGFWIKGMAPWCRKFINWDDIIEIGALHFVPGRLAITVVKKSGKYVHIFEDTGGWEMLIHRMCEKYPSFSLSQLEAARDDPYEQVHICWSREEIK
jgi:hypothetical protein